MQLTMTKTDVLQRIRQERSWWDELASRTSNDQMSDIKVTDDWTIRDFASHLLDWWSWKLTRLEALVSGRQIPNPPWPADRTTLDEQNAWFAEQNSDLSAREITDSYSQTFVLLEDIVAGMSEEELADRRLIPFLEGTSLGESIARGSFFGHTQESHAAEIAKWQERVR